METICKIDGCEKPVAVKLRGLCRSHFQTWTRKNKPKGKKPCTVEECKNIFYARGFCQTHYNNFRLTGSPVLPIKPKPARPDCACGNPSVARGLCKACYQRWYYYNTAGTGQVRTKKDEVGYLQAHGRVRTQRGFPHWYWCADGCGKQAEEWALRADADGDNIRWGPATKGREQVSKYSLDVNDYQPMTKDCHRRYDAQTGNRNFKTDGKYIQYRDAV